MLDTRVGQALTIKYDLLTMMPQTFAPLERVIFDYNPQPGEKTKGELFMELIDADHEIMIIDLYRSWIGESTWLSDVSDSILDPPGFDNMTLLYLALDEIFSQMIREDFHILRNFTVKEAITENFGKWPSALGSAIFVDSRHIFENALDSLKTNAEAFADRNNYDEDARQQVGDMYELVKQRVRA
jgi:hypothetical protein